MTVPETLSRFLDHLSGAAPGAAPDDVFALADAALARGMLDASPSVIVAYVSVSDCTSRLLSTQRARTYEKVRRVGTDVLRATRHAAERAGLPTPAVHMRLRHAASLLAGHGPEAWTQLMHALEAASRDAGLASVTGPLVAWNVLPICDLAPHVLSATPHVSFRVDLGAAPDPDDVRAVALSLLVTHAAAPAVLSAGAAACEAMDPDRVDLHARTVMPGLSTHHPAVVAATARTLADIGRDLARAICDGRPAWRDGRSHLDVHPAQYGTLPADDGLLWTNAGWPVTRPEPNRILPGNAPDADSLADRLLRLLSAVSRSGPRYALVDLS